MRGRTLRTLAAAVVATITMGGGLGVATAGGSSADAKATWSGEDRHHGRCADQFDRVAREDMEAFRDYDAETWRDLHHPAAETVLASGHRFAGVDAIMTALAGHFQNREAIFEWTELSRFIDRTCTSGFVVYETRYRLPSIGFDQSATTTVTFVRERGQWKVVFDQGTELPAS